MLDNLKFLTLLSRDRVLPACIAEEAVKVAVTVAVVVAAVLLLD
jgi:hypothetical protein